jgi:hypothetical protein
MKMTWHSAEPRCDSHLFSSSKTRRRRECESRSFWDWRATRGPCNGRVLSSSNHRTFSAKVYGLCKRGSIKERARATSETYSSQRSADTAAAPDSDREERPAVRSICQATGSCERGFRGKIHHMPEIRELTVHIQDLDTWALWDTIKIWERMLVDTIKEETRACIIVLYCF